MAAGDWRVPVLPPTPTENWRGSEKPCSGTWQEAQEMDWSVESFFSKNSLLPSLSFSSVMGLSAGITALSASSPGGKFILYGAGAFGASSFGGSGSFLAQLAIVRASVQTKKMKSPRRISKPRDE